MEQLGRKSLNEEQVIASYFGKSISCPDTTLGIGDDAAIINPRGSYLAVATDTLVEGVHFKPDADAADIGHKALAVNLSDLAAVAAKPRWALLALTIPDSDADWLKAFSDGFFRLAEQHEVRLIGGDTTKGKLTITVQLIGTIAENKILRRDKAQAGEGIYVTGRIGDAAMAALHAAALKSYTQSYQQCLERMLRPTARVAEGMILARYADAAIDISDGVFKDLSRLLSASAVGANIAIESIPTIAEINLLCPTLEALIKALIYGEDYELLFTLKDEYLAELTHAFGNIGTALTRIGTIEKKQGLRCYYRSKPVELPEQLGYDHFG
ncbi:MAG: thiamine-phosphate kinase [Chromatiales bacterium]|nr:thiamine-phosphate kinase [Chromatiales bacterium]